MSPSNKIEIQYTQIFIDNEWCKASNGKTFAVFNPTTGEELCQVEEATQVNDRWITVFSGHEDLC
jgi:hypothetical protein